MSKIIKCVYSLRQYTQLRCPKLPIVRWDAVDAEIEVPSAENPELSKASSCKPFNMLCLSTHTKSLKSMRKMKLNEPQRQK